MRVTIAHNNNEKTLKVVKHLRECLEEKNVVFDAKYPGSELGTIVIH